MFVTIELTDEEKIIVESYSNLHSVSLEEAFKRALIERIEDENDAKVAEEAYREYVESGCKSSPIEELWAELDWE